MIPRWVRIWLLRWPAVVAVTACANAWGVLIDHATAAPVVGYLALAAVGAVAVWRRPPIVIALMPALLAAAHASRLVSVWGERTVPLRWITTTNALRDVLLLSLAAVFTHVADLQREVHPWTRRSS
jgi:hypothetical protein